MNLKFGFKEVGDEVYEKFKNTLIKENSTRFAIMLSVIAISQLALILIEVTSVVKWITELFLLRILAFVISTTFIIIFVKLMKMEESERKLKLLARTQFVLHIIALAYGFFFTFYLFSIGMHTYTVFLFTTLLVSVNHTRHPYRYNVTLVIRFLILFIFCKIYFSVPFYFVAESSTIISLSIVIAIGNVFKYRVRWNSFLKEEEIAKMNKKLISISEIDELTGLYNRRRILDEISESISRTARYKEDFCVALLDLDHFKKVNDKFGHNVGDKVLCEFSSFLGDNLRESDILGRWGGEEFIIISPNTKKDGAFKLIDRIRKMVEDYSFEYVGKITFSAGISEFHPEYTDDKLIGNADLALYRSKNSGRNLVSIHECA